DRGKRLRQDRAAPLHAQPAGGDLPTVPPLDGHPCHPERRASARELGRAPGADGDRARDLRRRLRSGRPLRRADRGESVSGMGAPQGTEQADVEAENARLRERVRELEAELVDVQERANAAVAHWQERAYWLDRWHIDLNALMRRRGASEFRALVRAARSVVW